MENIPQSQQFRVPEIEEIRQDKELLQKQVKRYQKFRRGIRCRFCREKKSVDLKNITLLSKLCNPVWRMLPRKRNGNCRKHQAQVKLAVKYARFLALIPYEGQV
jgi:small subunit ribosomal protein S18